MKYPTYIASLSSVSALGSTAEEIWNNYKNPRSFITYNNPEAQPFFAAFLPAEVKEEIEKLRNENPHFKDLDESVLFSIYVSRKATKDAGWRRHDSIGINIGSSRGATGLFEKYHREYLETGKAAVLASPATTLGNISSWVAQDLQSNGPEISHSVTCSTGLHSVLNGIAWLQSGLSEKFLAGGSEASLTPFTLSQMKAMKIYASEEKEYPCEALKMDKTRNSMVLGEGAGVLCLKNSPAHSLAKISGIGYATEPLKHPASISANADCLQKSMKMAIGNTPLEMIDAVVMHAPGTIKGDAAEVNAIRKIFGENSTPALTSNKWKIGHTFGASGILSMELAVLMLKHQEFITVPFSEISKAPAKLDTILVNAVGFGGNAVSVLLSRS